MDIDEQFAALARQLVGDNEEEPVVITSSSPGARTGTRTGTRSGAAGAGSSSSSSAALVIDDDDDLDFAAARTKRGNDDGRSGAGGAGRTRGGGRRKAAADDDEDDGEAVVLRESDAADGQGTACRCGLWCAALEPPFPISRHSPLPVLPSPHLPPFTHTASRAAAKKSADDLDFVDALLAREERRAAGIEDDDASPAASSKGGKKGTKRTRGKGKDKDDERNTDEAIEEQNPELQKYLARESWEGMRWCAHTFSETHLTPRPPPPFSPPLPPPPHPTEQEVRKRRLEAMEREIDQARRGAVDTAASSGAGAGAAAAAAAAGGGGRGGGAGAGADDDGGGRRGVVKFITNIPAVQPSNLSVRVRFSKTLSSAMPVLRKKWGRREVEGGAAVGLTEAELGQLRFIVNGDEVKQGSAFEAFYETDDEGGDDEDGPKEPTLVIEVHQKTS
jgi:hypothetical protein